MRIDSDLSADITKNVIKHSVVFTLFEEDGYNGIQAFLSAGYELTESVRVGADLIYFNEETNIDAFGGPGGDALAQLVHAHGVHGAAVVARDHVEVVQPDPVLLTVRQFEAESARLRCRVQVLPWSVVSM